MRTVTRTERVGELLGPIDWSYDFRKHFDNVCSPDAVRDEMCEKSKERLRLLLNGEEWEATTYGGWPRCGWGLVVHIGMYDGWPYWRPVPSVAIVSTLGGVEWHPFHSITNIRHVGQWEELL